MGMRWIAVTILVALVVCGAAFAQQQAPPASSLEKLQNAFGDIRDQLWERNEEFWHRGEFNRCIAMMRVITSMDPHDTEAYEGGAWLMDSDLRAEDAEAFLIEGLRNNPDVYSLYFELGSFYYFRTRYEEAIPLYEACMIFAETPPFVRHQLAHAYEKNGNVGDSLECWLESEAAEPGNPVPTMQIERVMTGGEPSHVPESITRSIQHRKDERAKELGE